jgi:hypothetical protein
MTLRIAPFIHGGSIFRTVIILLGIDSPAACDITFKNDSHKSSKLFPELISSNKMSNIFVKYNMIQFINEPTHFTENSSSCIDLISSTDPNVIDLIHVGQPFLNVNVRYHCPIYGIFKVPKKLHTIDLH